MSKWYKTHYCYSGDNHIKAQEVLGKWADISEMVCKIPRENLNGRVKTTYKFKSDGYRSNFNIRFTIKAKKESDLTFVKLMLK